MYDDITRGCGVEVDILKPDNFLIIKETLTRIGIFSEKNQTLSQSCNILHKQGRYFIIHFLEMFKLDGKKSNFEELDRNRRDYIVSVLEDWELIKVISPKFNREIQVPPDIKILSHNESKKYKLQSKYMIGVHKKN